MAIDLSIYLNDLTTVEFVPLDPGDNRLAAIRDAYDARKWIDAAKLATDLAVEGVFDITPISYALYGAFREEGIDVIDSIFDVLKATFGQNFKAIGPTDRRETFFTTRVIWLLGTIRDNLEYYQKKGGPEWTALREKLTSAEVQDILGHAKQLEETLADPKWEKVTVSLAALVTMLRDFGKIFAKEEEQAKAAAVAKANAEAAAAATNPVAGLHSVDDVPAMADDDDPETDIVATNDADSPAAISPAVSPNAAAKKTVTLRVSPQFFEFMAKLQAFETLVSRGQHMKAAIVAEDVQNILDHFDPRVYFPDLLSRFSQLLCENAEELEEGLRFQNSFIWKTTTQFYQVDLEKFVHGKKG